MSGTARLLGLVGLVLAAPLVVSADDPAAKPEKGARPNVGEWVMRQRTVSRRPDGTPLAKPEVRITYDFVTKVDGPLVTLRSQELHEDRKTAHPEGVSFKPEHGKWCKAAENDSLGRVVDLRETWLKWPGDPTKPEEDVALAGGKKLRCRRVALEGQASPRVDWMSKAVLGGLVRSVTFEREGSTVVVSEEIVLEWGESGGVAKPVKG